MALRRIAAKSTDDELGQRLLEASAWRPVPLTLRELRGGAAIAPGNTVRSSTGGLGSPASRAARWPDCTLPIDRVDTRQDRLRGETARRAELRALRRCGTALRQRGERATDLDEGERESRDGELT